MVLACEILQEPPQAHEVVVAGAPGQRGLAVIQTAEPALEMPAVQLGGGRNPRRLGGEVGQELGGVSAVGGEGAGLERGGQGLPQRGAGGRSCGPRGRQPETRLGGAGELPPDILGRKVYVPHGGADLRVTQQGPQRRQRDARPDHVRGEGVAEAVRIGGRHPALAPVMSEQRAEAGRAQRLATLPALEHHEERRRVRQRPLHAEVGLEQMECLRGKRQDAVPIPFP